MSFATISIWPDRASGVAWASAAPARCSFAAKPFARACGRYRRSQDVEITTLEGLAKGGQLHPIQQAWIDEQVPACGFCQNGQILTAKALLDKTPNPTDAQIRDGMKNTLCRCMTYYRINAAVKLAARRMA